MTNLKLRDVLLLSFFVRLIVTPFFSDDFNYWANLTFTSFLFAGKNPWIVTYNDPTLHWINPWRCPPLQLFLAIPPHLANSLTGNYILMLFAMRLPLILIDTLSVFFAYKILRMWSDDDKRNIRYLLLFALNPISLLASEIAGLTDPLVTLFLIIALFYFLKPTENFASKNVSALLLGAAIAAKLFPIVFLPVFLLKLRAMRERIFFVILALLPVALVSVPFLMWDYGSYVNTLLFLNVGGFNPFVTFLNPALSTLLKVTVALTSILMFGISYFRKTDVLASIVLAFLALYALMGFGYFDTKYFSWFIPFAVLLASRRETLRIPKSVFLPFIYLPSLVGFLIYNGPRNGVEGMTGFFYFAYQWLRLKVIVFQVLPFSSQIYIATGIASIALIGYFFVAITIRGPFLSFPAIRFERLNVARTIRKNMKLILLLLLITLVSVVVFARVTPYEAMVMGVVTTNSDLHFYDNFSRSILNPQWSVAGTGNYSIQDKAKPSYIHLNGNITLYRGWGSTWEGFKVSNETQVKLIFRLDQIPQIANESSILVTNGGWFGVMKENRVYNFVYIDQATNQAVLKIPVDYQLHRITLDYNESCRQVTVDDTSSIALPKEVFSYLCLGLPINSSAKMMGCSFSVNDVEVYSKDFYPNVSSVIYIFTALFVPPVLIICILVFVSKRKH